MKSLQTLIKLMKTKTDNQRRFLAEMDAALEAVEMEIAELVTRSVIEQETARQDPNCAFTYADFVKRSQQKAFNLEIKKIGAIASVEIARDKLAELFEEQKRYEIAMDNRIAQARKEEGRKETIMLDEIGSVSFARKMKKS